MTPCARLAESGGTVSDGMGGTLARWEESEGFEAAFAYERTDGQRLGDRDVSQDTVRVTVRWETSLQFHDVFRRLSDGAVFRVTSNGGEYRTPDGAGLDMRQVRAERWALPT